MLSRVVEPFLHLPRERAIRWLGHAIIFVVGLFMAVMLSLRHDADVAAARQHFREIQLAKTHAEVDKIEAAFKHLHQELKTISLIPGIRTIERHAFGVNADTLTVIAQLYRNLSADLDVSEIDVVPLDFDPEHVDMLTRRTDEPILTFDSLMGRVGMDAGGGTITPRIPGNRIEPSSVDRDQRDAAEEYGLLKAQLSWLRRNVPRLEPGSDANVPLVAGPEVATRAGVEPMGHLDDRRGLVFSVPFYDFSGQLKGTVSAIIRTSAIRALLPGDSMLVNTGHALAIEGPREELQDAAFEHARQLELDPDLIYSTMQEIATDDVSGRWVLWDGETNRTFLQSADAKFADVSYAAALAIAVLLVLSATIVWHLVQRTMQLKAANERDLIAKVAERTRDFELLMESTLKAEAEAEIAKREALSEANALLEEFIARAPAAIAMFDRNLVYIAHTRRWATEHHADGRSLVGQTHFEALPAIASAWDQAFRDCLEGEIRCGEAEPFVQPDGRIQWLTWEIRPWHAADGSVRGLIMMTEDVTARKEIEAELQIALETAQSAARVKADFLANMSHELRTPLSGIIGSADILLADADSPLSPEHQKLIELQRRCGADLLAIVNDILDFSKADAGNLKLEAIPVDIAELVGNCVATVRPNADQKCLNIVSKIAPDVLPTIVGDPTRLRQVLLNLLSNAVKFTPQSGTVRVDVSMVGATRMRFSVADTGIGITHDQIGGLFTRFSQADTSTTRTFGGTGLGLAICRQLVELMQGRIDVTSQIGLGSTFFFDMPAVAVAAKSADAPVQSAHMGVSRHRVLVAEDNATNRLLVSKMLQKYGCAITLVTNGAEAVAALTGADGHDFDIVLMDIQMPEMDGQEATRRIRAHEAARPDRRHVPIVALTANGFPDEVAQYLAVGMDTHILKPIDWQKLFATIESLATTGVDPDDSDEAAITDNAANKAA